MKTKRALLFLALSFGASLVSAAPIVYNAPTNVVLGIEVDVLPVVVKDGACTSSSKTNTGISSDKKIIYTCVDDTWKALEGEHWKPPVSTYANLASHTSTDPVGAARVTMDTGRVFVRGGAGWVAAAIDQNGNLSVPGNLTISGNTALNGNATLNGNTTLNGRVVIGDGSAAAPDGSNTLVVNRTATEGHPCSPNGAVARDNTGLILSCQSGMWSPQRSLGGSYQVSNKGCNIVNPKTGALSCPPGYVSTWAYVSMGPNVCTSALDQSTLYLCVR